MSTAPMSTAPIRIPVLYHPALNNNAHRLPISDDVRGIIMRYLITKIPQVSHFTYYNMTSRANVKALFKCKFVKYLNLRSGKAAMEDDAVYIARRLIKYGSKKIIKYIAYNCDSYGMTMARMLVSAIKYHGAIDSSILCNCLLQRMDNVDTHRFILDNPKFYNNSDELPMADKYLIKRLFKYPAHIILDTRASVTYARLLHEYSLIIRIYAGLRFGPGVGTVNTNDTAFKNIDSGDLIATKFKTTGEHHKTLYESIHRRYHDDVNTDLIPYRAIFKYAYNCSFTGNYTHIIEVMTKIINSDHNDLSDIYYNFASAIKKYKGTQRYDVIYNFMYTIVLNTLECEDDKVTLLELKQHS